MKVVPINPAVALGSMTVWIDRLAALAMLSDVNSDTTLMIVSELRDLVHVAEESLLRQQLEASARLIKETR
jgi:hypothetical protein